MRSQAGSARRPAPIALGLATFAAAAALGACAPTADNSGCSSDDRCDRGQFCNLETNMCEDEPVDTTNTENPAPANFSAKPVPFHRGQVCLEHEVKAGEDIPVTLNPCLHPCLEKGAFKHKHYYSCFGNTCEAWAVMYVEATAMTGPMFPDGCPADAFGAFDRNLCSYGPAVELSIGTTIGDGPINGRMTFEIPFLNNVDMAAIAANFDDNAFIQEKIDQYPPQDNRIPGGKDIVMSSGNPAPPAMCDGMTNCTCYDVGF